MNLEQTAQLVTILAGYYPGWTPTEETIHLWAREMGPLDPDAALETAADLARTESRWPTLAGFLHRYADRAGLLAPSPAEAWEEVSRMIAQRGRMGVAEWSHPAVARTVEAIGWWPLCMSENPDTIRAQFRRAYEEFAAPADRGAVTSMQVDAPRPLELAAVEAPEITNMRRSMEAQAARELEAGEPVAPPADLAAIGKLLRARPDPMREARKRQREVAEKHTSDTREGTPSETIDA